MNNFEETMRTLNRRAEENCIEGDVYNNIYIDCCQEFADKHSLPALHIWETGYCKGDASDEELDELVNNDLISRYKDDEDDEDEDYYYDFTDLNDEFIELFENKLDKFIENNNNQYFEKIKTIDLKEFLSYINDCEYDSYEYDEIEGKNCDLLYDTRGNEFEISDVYEGSRKAEVRGSLLVIKQNCTLKYEDDLFDILENFFN